MITSLGAAPLPPQLAGLAAVQGQATPPAPPLDPAILASEAIELADGGIELVAPEEMSAPDPRDAPHDANLAELLPDATLSGIAAELLEGIESDIASNSETFEIYAAGLKLLGLKPGERLDRPYKGAPAAIHPHLLEAVIRYQAGASGELMPADGPARCRVFGDSTPETEGRSKRKQDWLNYYLTEVDEEYYPDFDQMLLLQGLYGSMFRKVWRDPLREGLPTSRHLTPFDLITSAETQSLAGPWRVTQIEPVPRAELTRLQLQDWYRSIDLAEPGGEEAPSREFQRFGFRTPADRPEDAEHVLLHCHCMLDVPELAHVGEDGTPSGLPLPYVVTLDWDTQRVLRIARNWAAGDATFRPREYFVHYRYMPGLGFLGWGLIHIAGSTADTLTLLRRKALAAFSFAAFPGGLRAKGGVKMEDNDLAIGPGEFHEIDTGGLPIGNAVMPLPYRDVPPSFAPLMQEVLTAGQRVASTADMAVGDGREDAAVGTVLALVEKATKIEGAVIKRQHRSQRKELRLLADLFGADAAAEYPYIVNGQQGRAIAQDFRNNADVVPVSDPNLPTQTQRLAQAQATLTLATQSGGVLSIKVAAEDMLRTMGKSDAEIARLMPPPQMGQPADPVAEFDMLMKGLPLAVGPLQDDAAHMTAHMAQMAAPGLAKLPQMQTLLSHLADHMAAHYRKEASRLIGAPLPPPALPAGPMGAGAPPVPPLPPEVENQIAAAVAAASAQLRQSLAGLLPGGAEGEGDKGMDPQEAQLRLMELQVQQAEGARKAEAEARQDQVELIRQRAQNEDSAAERAADLEEARIKLEQERVKARAQVESARINHAGEAAGTLGGIAAAALGHEAERMRAATSPGPKRRGAKGVERAE